MDLDAVVQHKLKEVSLGVMYTPPLFTSKNQMGDVHSTFVTKRAAVSSTCSLVGRWSPN